MDNEDHCLKYECFVRFLTRSIPADMAESKPSVSNEEEPEKHTDLPCGYNEFFVNPVDGDLQCCICQSTLRDPVLTRCGHRFCSDCLERYMTRFVYFNIQYERITRNRYR